MLTTLFTPMSDRKQRAKSLSWCTSSFVTEGEIKYCIAKLFSKGKNGEVQYATAADY